MLINIALDDAYFLGVLSSGVHITWALAAGGRLGVGNDPRYNKTRCFDPFPFPDAAEQHKARIRELGESLDAHRKRQQTLHTTLTITDMYNVLEKLRRHEPLTEKERVTHEHGLVSVLKQIHDDLDAAVFEAYGWPSTLTDQEILQRLVDLNAERAREERSGLIRWLRPEFQNPAAQTQAALIDTEKPLGDAPLVGVEKKLPWPTTLAEQAKAVRTALSTAGVPVSAETLAKQFKGANKTKVRELLETLSSLGHAREIDAGTFVG